MSTAQRLHDEGKIEGKIVGKLQMLEEFLGLTPTPDDILAEKSREELEARFLELEKQYHQRFR
jgi:hypothetical protein